MSNDTNKHEWALEQLIPDDRKVLEMREDRCTYDAIAATLGVSPTRIYQRSVRARRRMLKLMTSGWYDVVIARTNK